MILAFREAGPVSLLALGLFVFPGLVAVILQAAIGHRLRIAAGTWVAVLLPAIAGVYGYAHARSTVDGMLHLASGASLDPRVMVALRAHGYREAMRNAWIGGGLSVVLAVLAVCALGVNALRRRSRTQEGEQKS